jgi:hypothetical protein
MKREGTHKMKKSNQGVRERKKVGIQCCSVMPLT